MLRKIQLFLIRAIAAGRPVMLNVHVSQKSITVLGNGAHIEGCKVKDAPAPAIVVSPSMEPRFSLGERHLATIKSIPTDIPEEVEA